LRRTVERLRAEHVVGVGRFAADRAAAALRGSGIKLGVMPHPSPASPAANRGWAAQATRALADLGIAL
jgi:single-strand selective monofunctional uracil DNA glycosylase